MSLQKRKPIRSQKIRDAARGEACTMRLPGICNYDDETVVFCHSNYGEDGKGMGQKADDLFGFFGCSACHSAYDQAHDESGDYWRYCFHRAMKRTWRRLYDKGVIKI